MSSVEKGESEQKSERREKEERERIFFFIQPCTFF